MSRIKKNDTVFVLNGRDGGKSGLVIDLIPDKDLVMVKDVAVKVHHVKARKAGESSGLKKKESFIPVSKVMPICSNCKKPCRVNAKFVENGDKVRVCNRCEKPF